MWWKKLRDKKENAIFLFFSKMLARQSILTYEIGRKLEQETKGEITL